MSFSPPRSSGDGGQGNAGFYARPAGAASSTANPSSTSFLTANNAGGGGFGARSESFASLGPSAYETPREGSFDYSRSGVSQGDLSSVGFSSPSRSAAGGRRPSEAPSGVFYTDDDEPERSSTPTPRGASQPASPQKLGGRGPLPAPPLAMPLAPAAPSAAPAAAVAPAPIAAGSAVPASSADLYAPAPLPAAAAASSADVYAPIAAPAPAPVAAPALAPASAFAPGVSDARRGSGSGSPSILSSASPSGAPAGAAPHFSLSPLSPGTSAQLSTPRRGTTLASRKTEKSATSGGGKSLATLSSVVDERWLPSRWAGAFMITVCVEAAVVITMVAIVFAMIRNRTQAALGLQVQDLKTIPVFLALFVFGMLFCVAISLDANRLKNTIQVIGVCIFNLALIVTAALQIPQVKIALRIQNQAIGGVPPGLYDEVQKFLIVVPVVTGLAQIPITYLTYKLWGEYGWSVYKALGASIEQRRRFLVYQVFQVLLKYDFFFGVGFTMAYLILVSNRDDAEFGLTIAAIPVCIVLLFVSAFAARKEVKSLMLLCILAFLAGAAYFIYKITRIYAPSTADDYRTVRLTLTFFSIFAIISLFLTLANAIWCLLNFNKGLLEAHDSMGHLIGTGRRASRVPLGRTGGVDGTAAPPAADASAPPKLESWEEADEEASNANARVQGSNPHRLSLD
ncbi:hypothetical protein FA09DRAFT_304815 [Tilletiopsis washingtonensis]|uniref:Uncharacterized protein n=1 Tax=Tilletiopsis washingtonensis TaxID=58919 RepID=A0A316ZI43_9BASI|nr:hypothetical protein FA09DRAFT_304815 [Tilletiopsis washingtonensis]PWO00593.1 hypothetical protein FA09DRAFT_304815 [Tilletiopsis washingtonensis]